MKTKLSELKPLVLLTLLLLVMSSIYSESLDWKVLPKTNIPFSPPEMMKQYLNTEAIALLKSHEENPDRFPGKDNIEIYKKERRELYWNLLGGKPSLSPLNPVIVRKGTKPTYRYEVLYYESLPNFFVPAILFLPLTEPPYPGVILPCGHSLEAKGSPDYQKLGILLAENGIAALIYDPPGQGECITFIKEDGKPEFWGTTEHTVVGLGCILLGSNYAKYEIWNGVRALDYLATREDIKKEKFGCSGCSGGGTQTTYLMALEPRIYVAAPSCYLTSCERLLNTIGPQDAEQNIFSQIKYGYNHSDYIFMHAPNPVLVCCATRDFFDISGTWDTFREAKRLYSKLGVNQLCDLIEVDTEHGLGKAQCEEIVERMLLWLEGINKEVEEQIEDSELLTKEEYQACKSGNVSEIPNATNIVNMNREKEKEYAKIRESRWNSYSLTEKQSKVREIINVVDYNSTPDPVVDELERLDSKPIPEAKSIIPFIIKPEENIVLPGFLFESEQSVISVIIYTHPEGKGHDPNRIQDYLKKGVYVCAVDLRGTGETVPIHSKNDMSKIVGQGWEDSFGAYLIGKSYVGMRVSDYFAIIKYLKKKYENEVQIGIDATGILCVPAIHSAFLLLPQSIELNLTGLISWSETIENPRIQGQITNVVHGVLQEYDIPQLLSEFPDGKVTVQKTVPPTF